MTEPTLAVWGVRAWAPNSRHKSLGSYWEVTNDLNHRGSLTEEQIVSTCNDHSVLIG